MELYKSVVHLPLEDTGVALVIPTLKIYSSARKELREGLQG